MKITFLPESSLGKWSVGLIAIFGAFLGLFFLLVALGERGGATFFSNSLLTIPMLLAAISAIGSFFVGLISMVTKKERSLLVLLATLVGLLVLFWVGAEIFSPH